MVLKQAAEGGEVRNTEGTGNKSGEIKVDIEKESIREANCSRAELLKKKGWWGGAFSFNFLQNKISPISRQDDFRALNNQPNSSCWRDSITQHAVAYALKITREERMHFFGYGCLFVSWL